MKYLIITIALFVSSCMNMPTQPGQITGVYVSKEKYAAYDCQKLLTELDSLSRRESQLALAQEQRVKSSQSQAFWTGFGNGDGIEASELANVRGEKEAARTASEEKKCTNQK